MVVRVVQMTLQAQLFFMLQAAAAALLVQMQDMQMVLEVILLAVKPVLIQQRIQDQAAAAELEAALLLALALPQWDQMVL
jgi:hypothetical protein